MDFIGRPILSLLFSATSPPQPRRRPRWISISSSRVRSTMILISMLLRVMSLKKNSEYCDLFIEVFHLVLTVQSDVTWSLVLPKEPRRRRVERRPRVRRVPNPNRPPPPTKPPIRPPDPAIVEAREQVGRDYNIPWSPWRPFWSSFETLTHEEVRFKLRTLVHTIAKHVCSC